MSVTQRLTIIVLVTKKAIYLAYEYVSNKWIKEIQHTLQG
jgi:hypothetical protein